MIACPNKECANYKQELEDSVELCPLCGSKPEKFKAKNNQTLGVIALVVAFASFLTLWSRFYYLGFFAGPVSIVLAVLSRSVLFIILSVLLVLALVGAFILFVKPF